MVNPYNDPCTVSSLAVNKVRSDASIFITFMTHYVFNMTSFVGSESGVHFRKS